MASSPADQALTLIAFRQARRRTFNERLAEIEFAPEAMLYRCECGLVACETAIKLTGLDYMGVRANPRRFVVFGEHAILEAEDGRGDPRRVGDHREGPRSRRRLRRRDAYAVRGGRAVDGFRDVAVFDDLRRFYAEAYDEDVRLTRSPHGRLEFARTRELLERVAARAARAGARRGRRDGHPRALARRPPATRSRSWICCASTSARRRRSRASRASVGDARSLAVRGRLVRRRCCCSGRSITWSRPSERCARCARRCGSRGPAPWSPSPRSAATRACSTSAPTPASTAATRAARRATCSDRACTIPRLGFTTAYLHRPEELSGELVAAGLRDVEVYGVEGPAGPALDAHGIERIDEFLPSAIALRADRRARPGADRRQRAPAGVVYGTVSVVVSRA